MDIFELRRRRRRRLSPTEKAHCVRRTAVTQLLSPMRRSVNLVVASADLVQCSAVQCSGDVALGLFARAHLRLDLQLAIGESRSKAQFAAPLVESQSSLVARRDLCLPSAGRQMILLPLSERQLSPAPVAARRRSRFRALDSGNPIVLRCVARANVTLEPFLGALSSGAQRVCGLR